MRWCRLYTETPNDPKLRRIAHQAGTTVANVLAVWTSMLCHAAGNEGDLWGTIQGWDDLDIAINLGLDRGVVSAIRREMEQRIILEKRLIKWDQRQSKDDHSAERMRKWRARKTQPKQQPAADVTSPSVTVTQSDGKKRREEKRREDRESLTGLSSSSHRKRRDEASADPIFAKFWALYPRKVGKGAAERAWPAALKASGDWQAIIMGLQVQIDLERFDMRDDGKFVPHPSTWLNQKRWLDGIEPEPDAQPSLLERRA